MDCLQSGSRHGFKIDEETTINSLLYADDLVIFSTSKDELQAKLNSLNDYTSQWRLQVNMKKSKTICIDSKENVKFSFNGQYLENTDSYTYLGVNISKKGFQNSAYELAMKAQKAWYSLKYTLISQKVKDVSTVLHLFDTRIKPIITYGSEIWGSRFNSRNIFNLSSKSENIQIQCARWVLSVGRYCSNLGILGELGRLPILHSIKINVIKYLIHLENLTDKTRLLYKVYQYAKQNKTGWFQYATDCIKVLNIKTNITSLATKSLKASFIEKVKKKSYNIFNEQWKQNITKGTKKIKSKLRTYATFKKSIGLEKYLIETTDISLRQTFTKLRLSNHKLEIESGRYKNIDASKRFCTQCSSLPKQIEDEFHFVMVCAKHKKLRLELFSKISKSSNKFSKMNQKQKFDHIMNYKSNLNDILFFLKSAYDNRN